MRRAYRGKGSDAWPVDRLLVLALFQLHHRQPSPADWHRQAACHLGLRRLLGDRVPARSTLYAFRDRLADPLSQIQQTWLTRQHPKFPLLGQHLGIDGTFVAVHASRHVLLSESGLQRRLHTLWWARRLDALDAHLRGPAAMTWATLLVLALVCYGQRHHLSGLPLTPAWVARTPRGRHLQQQRYQRALQVLRDRPRSAYAQRKRRRHVKPRISPSAPEALLGRDKQHVYRPLVNAQIAVDLSSGLVTALTLPAQVNDANQLMPLSQASRQATGVAARRVAVDSGYVQLRQLRQAKEQGLEVFSSFAAEQEPAGGGREPFTAADFTWRGKERVYVCPQGERLTYRRPGQETRSGGERVALEIYQADAAAGRDCTQAGRCTKSPGKGRVIKRLAEEELREECRRRSGQEEGRLLRLARKSQVERVFADWKEHRGQTRICGRSEAAVQAQLRLTQLYFNARSTFTRSLH